MTTFSGKAFGVCAIVLLSILAGCKSPHSINPAAGTSEVIPADIPFAIVHGPLLQAPSETGVNISWATSQKSVSWVEYRPKSSKQWLTNMPAHHGLVDADTTHFNVSLKGLEPGTTYVYRAVSKEIASFKLNKATFGGTVLSAENQFTTLNSRKPAFSFVVLNDRHEKVAALAASLASINWTNVDLTFLNGDMVHAVTDEQQLYRCIFDPFTKCFGSRIPVVYVRGNHDTRGRFARHLLEYFPTESGRYYYSFVHGPVSFAVLDCGEDKTDESVEYSGLAAFAPYMREQVQWLEQQIKEPAWQKSAFRVALLHLPPAKRPDPKFIRQQWLMDNIVPLLNQGKVDLLICAHTHKYAIQPAGRNGMDFPVITGGIETVIHCDATPERILVSSSDLSGKPLLQLPSIERRKN